jgi:site-specific DNA-methyltransferase (adenine-specific)
MSATATWQDVLEGRARWCVVHGDNSTVLPEMPEKSVAHVITDPPYNAETHSRARSLKDGGSNIPIDFAALASFDFVCELLRVSRRWVVAFCAVEQLGDYRKVAGDAWVRGGMWDRPDGTPQLSADRPAQSAEGIAIMHDGRPLRWNSGGKRGTWRCPVERADRNHPTPKPVPLMLELVADFTDADELSLDPFAGSGTTGVAALRLGRRCILIERDEKYAAIARERMAAEERGLSLREARAGQSSIFDVLGNAS